MPKEETVIGFLKNYLPSLWQIITECSLRCIAQAHGIDMTFIIMSIFDFIDAILWLFNVEFFTITDSK